jgi:polar amino acid transport system substrate-binding protein
MKSVKMSKRIIILLILVTDLWAGTAAHAGENTVKITMDDWCPYVCNPDTEGGKLGYITDIIILILREKGFRIETRLMPYSRSLYELEKGGWNISPGMGKPNAPDFIFSARPVVFNTFPRF